MSNAVVLVTGAAGNMGRAILTRLFSDGAHVVAVDRETGALEAALGAHQASGDHLVLAGVDLTSADACKEMIRATLDRYGRIDGVVHTVGGFAMAGIDDAVAAQFESMFRLNVLTTVNVFGATVPAMRAAGRGSMIAIGASPGLKATSGMAAYAASKAGVHRIVEAYADELKAHNVRVNAILPSVLDTPQNRAAMPNEDPHKWVAPARIADTVAFLLQDGAADITGALLPVTGRV